MTVGAPGYGVWVGINQGGTSDPFPLGGLGSLMVSSSVVAVTAAGSLQVFLDVQDTAGAWHQEVALTAQTAAGVQTGEATLDPSVRGNLVQIGRLRWTSTGTFAAVLAAVGV